MPNATKHTIFNEKGHSDTISMVYGVDGVEAAVSFDVCAQRPDGFRFAKYIEVAIATANDVSAQGGGESRNSHQEALEKAKSEAVERLLLKIHSARTGVPITSNGWSAHLSTEAAHKNAALELFERDSALVHWFRSQPLAEVSSSSWPLSIRWWAMTELSRSEFPILQIFLTSEGYYPTVIALLRNKRGCGVAGTASGANLSKAVEAAISEACRSAHHSIRGTYSREAEMLLIAEIEMPMPGTHSVLYAGEQPFPDWFLSPYTICSWKSAQNLFSDEKLSAAIAAAEIKFQPIASGERYVVRAHSEKLQSVFWGSSLKLNVLNLDRINRNIENVNLLPHFVG